ncbi:MAG: hypothetical protein ACKVVP_08525 [Chloroflexota bacterium]
MIWQSYDRSVRPWLRAALIAVSLTPAFSVPSKAAPVQLETAPTQAIIFAVDPVLGQAYLALPDHEETSEHAISVRSLASSREIGSIPYSVPPSALSVNPLTSLIYIANKTQDTVTVVHGPTLRVVTTARIAGGPQILLVEPAAGRLYVGLGRDQAIRVLDMSTLTTIGVIELGFEPLALGFDRVRNRLLATTAGTELHPPALAVIDSERLVSVALIPLPASPDGLAVLDVLGLVYIPIAQNGELVVVNIDKLQIVNQLKGFESRVRSVAVNERRSRLYIAAGDADLIIVLDPITGTILGSIETGSATDALAVDQATARIYSASMEASTISVALDPVGPTRAFRDVQITFQVTGGLAGLNDVLTITPPGRSELQRRSGPPLALDLGFNRFEELVALFEESDFYSMRPLHRALRPIPDALTFSVTIKEQQREHTVVMSTSGSPPVPLMDIVRRLERVRQEMITPPVQVTSGS